MSNIYTISQINTHLSGLLNSDPLLNYIEVRGEIINLKRYTNAIYFTLKEGDASRLSAVCFSLKAFPASLKEGDEVVVGGKIGVYVKSGAYQITCYNISYYGEGAKLLELAKLKRKLESEGLFDITKKQKLPTYPKTIGLITPKDSAAYSDVVTNLGRRYPNATLKVIWATFQGVTAPDSLIKAFQTMEEQMPDVILIARGGGSSDDLWAFNDEMLVRALSKRRVPLISAIGHEIDTTLTDYIADVRASTPTMAAELAVPDQNELLMDISSYQVRMLNTINSFIKQNAVLVKNLAERPVLKKIDSLTSVTENSIKTLTMRLTAAAVNIINNQDKVIIKLHNSFEAKLNNTIEQTSATLNRLKSKLESLNPQEVLKRGYAFISKDETIVTSKQSLEVADNIKITFNDGSVIATVKGTNNE